MIKQVQNLPVLVAAAFAAACSGGHSSTVASPSANAPLTMGAIANLSAAQDTKVTVPVIVTETPVSPITLTATSSDATLLPAGAIQVVTGGGAQQLNLTPADGAVGSATITVIAADSKKKSASRSFNVTFNPVYASFATLALGAFAEPDTATPVPVLGKTYVEDADDPSTFSALLR